MTKITKDNALLTEKWVKIIGQDEKRDKKLKELLEIYKKTERNKNWLTILWGIYNKNKVLLDFDLLEFRKEWKILKYIFLNEKQREAFRIFQNDDNIVDEISYWGWAGWWKSFILNLIVFLNSIMLPWSWWFVWRKKLNKVKTSTIKDLIKMMKECWFEWYNHNNTDHFIYFDNESFIHYWELENLPWDPNFSRLWSYEYTWIFIDESQETVIWAKSALRFRLRLTRKSEITEDWTEKIIWKKRWKMYYSNNPWKNWLFTDFFIPWDKWVLDEKKAFIQALPEDNEFLGDDAIDLYKNSEDEIYKQIYYYWNRYYDNDPAILFKYDDLNQIFFNNLSKISSEYYITCDVSGQWKDKTIIIIWKWYEIIYIYKEDKSNSVSLSNKLKEFEKEYWVKRKNVVIDATWIGSWTADILEWCIRFMWAAKSIERKEEEIRKINWYDKEYTKILYQNDRSACFFKLADLVKKSGIYISYDAYKEDIINEFSFIKEIVSVSDTIVRKIISKEQIKKFLGNSPDFADAISMRMVFDFDIEEEEYDVYNDKWFTIFW